MKVSSYSLRVMNNAKRYQATYLSSNSTISRPGVSFSLSLTKNRLEICQSFITSPPSSWSFLCLSRAGNSCQCYCFSPIAASFTFRIGKLYHPMFVGTLYMVSVYSLDTWSACDFSLIWRICHCSSCAHQVLDIIVDLITCLVDDLTGNELCYF